LSVQEFDDPPQLSGNSVSYEEHSNLPSLKVGPNLAPKGLDIGFRSQETNEGLSRILGIFGTTGLEARPQLFYWPIDDAVGSVIQHLTNDFASDPGVRPSFYLYQGRYSLLI